MLVTLVKTIIISLLVFFVIRLMGKRQIGEMQPFEFVITLILAEVACLPMNNGDIPLHNGIVPIIALAFLDIFITFLGKKSYKFRKLTDGGSIIVLDKKGLVYENLQKMNMSVDDVLVSARSGGYADISNLDYIIVEPNGKVSFIEKGSSESTGLPIPLIVDGKLIEKNISYAGITEAAVEKVILGGGLKSPKDVLYMDIRENGKVYVSPKKKPYYTDKLRVGGKLA